MEKQAIKTTLRPNQLSFFSGTVVLAGHKAVCQPWLIVLRLPGRLKAPSNLERFLERSEDLIWLLLHLPKTNMTMENTRRKMYLQLQIANFPC